MHTADTWIVWVCVCFSSLAVIASTSCVIFQILQLSNFLQQILITGNVAAHELTHAGKSHTDFTVMVE